MSARRPPVQTALPTMRAGAVKLALKARRVCPSSASMGRAKQRSSRTPGVASAGPCPRACAQPCNAHAVLDRAPARAGMTVWPTALHRDGRGESCGRWHAQQRCAPHDHGDAHGIVSSSPVASPRRAIEKAAAAWRARVRTQWKKALRSGFAPGSFTTCAVTSRARPCTCICLPSSRCGSTTSFIAPPGSSATTRALGSRATNST